MFNPMDNRIFYLDCEQNKKTPHKRGFFVLLDYRELSGDNFLYGVHDVINSEAEVFEQHVARS